jgi:hypothetical protein
MAVILSLEVAYENVRCVLQSSDFQGGIADF